VKLAVRITFRLNLDFAVSEDGNTYCSEQLQDKLANYMATSSELRELPVFDRYWCCDEFSTE